MQVDIVWVNAWDWFFIETLWDKDRWHGTGQKPSSLCDRTSGIEKMAPALIFFGQGL